MHAVSKGDTYLVYWLHKSNSEIIYGTCYESKNAQPAKLQKKQCGGVYFCVYGTAFPMPIQQKLPPPVLLFSNFAGWASK